MQMHLQSLRTHEGTILKQKDAITKMFDTVSVNVYRVIQCSKFGHFTVDQFKFKKWAGGLKDNYKKVLNFINN